MAVVQHGIAPHALPWWLELIGAALIGAAILFGVLLLAGHSDLLPWTSTANNAPAVVLPGKAADDLVLNWPGSAISLAGKAEDDLITSWPR